MLDTPPFYLISLLAITPIIASRGVTRDYSASVRNGDAGRPAPFTRLCTAVWCHAKRTAVGWVTESLDTMTVVPSITAAGSFGPLLGECLEFLDFLDSLKKPLSLHWR